MIFTNVCCVVLMPLKMSNVNNIQSCYNNNMINCNNLSVLESESDLCIFIKEFKNRVYCQLNQEEGIAKCAFKSFNERIFRNEDIRSLLEEKNLPSTPNQICSVNYLSEQGFITCLVYSPNGYNIMVGYSTGLIQLRHGLTGTVLYTLRNIQFPPKPIYAIEFSRTEERVCYASCMDGNIYRIEIPLVSISNEELPTHCIRADPGLDSLNVQFYGSPGISSHATPFITHRSAPLSFGINADYSKMVVGYADTSVKVFDMETQNVETTFKIHKLRLQFVPKKLQRMHFGQVCALRCHDQKTSMFASGAWDKTLRIWDLRCKVGCVTTFEGVDICSDSIDLNREQCITGSWQPTEALAVWDLTAKKRLNVIRVQNRRPDVDGEYVYACRYWRSSEYNRKGKYAIIGGSGTNCVEVINLHNRYISCSYPAAGTVLSVTSHDKRIAFGGTASVFNIVAFHDPKHEKFKKPVEEGKDLKSLKSEYSETSFDNIPSQYSPYDDNEEHEHLPADITTIEQ